MADYIGIGATARAQENLLNAIETLESTEDKEAVRQEASRISRQLLDRVPANMVTDMINEEETDRQILARLAYVMQANSDYLEGLAALTARIRDGKLNDSEGS